MSLPLLIVAFVALLGILIVTGTQRTRNRVELEKYSISPEELHELLASHQDLCLVDVRQPLDLLADTEIIPGAIRISPKEVLQNPFLIPTDQDVIVYCTCPGDETSRRVLTRALAMHLSRIKLLKGGLAGWKAKGYPIVPYDKPFRLDVSDTPRNNPITE